MMSQSALKSTENDGSTTRKQGGPARPASRNGRTSDAMGRARSPRRNREHLALPTPRAEPPRPLRRVSPVHLDAFNSILPDCLVPTSTAVAYLTTSRVRADRRSAEKTKDGA